MTKDELLENSCRKISNNRRLRFLFLEYSKNLPGFYTFREKYDILKNGGVIPVCFCGNLLRFSGVVWQKFCSTLCANKSPETKEKKKQTFIAHFGVETNLLLPEMKQKFREGCLEKYGVENPFQSDEIKRKVKQTMLERYGVENASQSSIIQERKVQTSLERYGVENPMQSEEIRMKATKTLLERYGVTNASQIHLSSIIHLIEDQNWWNTWNCFSEVKDYLLPYMTVAAIYRKAHKFRPEWDFNNISSPHQRINSLLDSFNIQYVINTKQIIAPLELDIFLPEYQIAIEVNGLYWHSELAGNKSKEYHLNKFLQCQAKGIRLLQFWDSEVNQKWPIVSSMIQNRLGLINNRIGARECVVHKVTKQQERDFLQQNHLQGYVNSSLALGLYKGGEVISLMSFREPRFNKRYKWELLRFATKAGMNVSGAASRLFKQRSSGSIITYADQRYSDGSLYKQLGFEYKETSNPNYYYTSDYENLESRMKYQKHKLQNLLESYNPDETEWSNMVANGFDRVWDCGCVVFDRGD